MQIYSCSIWLLLTFAFVLIHARNLRMDFNDDSNINEQRREIYFHKPSPSIVKKFYNMFTNGQYIPYDQDQLTPMARRTKAIIKGDPREFMG